MLTHTYNWYRLARTTNRRTATSYERTRPLRGVRVSMAARNNNPMPYSPGNSGEVRILLDTLALDWSEQLLSNRPDWNYLDNLNDWIEEAQELLDEFDLRESWE